jgi:hypothetical protein
MNRSLRTFAITFGIGMLLFGGGYLLSRPTWRTATEEEVLSQLDPDLLVRPQEVPESRARYRRFASLLDRVPLTGITEVTEGSVRTTVHTRGASHLEALEALLREGPIQAPLEPPKGLELQAVDRSRNLVRELIRAAGQESVAGRSESAGRLLRLTLLLHNRLSEHAATMPEFLGGASRVVLLFNGWSGATMNLDQALLTQLAAEMPPARMDDDPVLRQAIGDDLRTAYVPIIADPVGWSRREDPAQPGQPLGMALQEHPDEIRIRGNFDALETARDLNRSVIPWHRNTRRLRKDQDLSGDVHLRSLERSLPSLPRWGTGGLGRRLSDWKLGWDKARVPNSFGRQLLVGASSGSFQPWLDTSFRTRATWEGLRTTLALRRYRLAKGHPAPSLQALVDAELLAQLPYDHLGSGPLQYDPARSVLWSVGTDGKDDGGTAMPGLMGQSDIVWVTP